MLSRIAESLFWVGRYLERAEDTARILDVQIHQLLEGATEDEALASRVLRSVMGVSGDGAAGNGDGSAQDEEHGDGDGDGDEESSPDLDLSQVTALLAFDTTQPSSIVSSLVGARENARGVRETISSELWECLNATYVALDQRVATARAIGPHAFFRFAKFVKERVALGNGIAEATMSRDDGWHFLVLGRSLERADMTARLLGVRLNLPESAADWVTTLRCCSAHEAYLRTYRGSVDAAHATEFLLLDRLFPRSAYFALATAEDCLSALGTDRGRLASGDEARRILGRARSALEHRQIDELLAELPLHLSELQRSCSQAALAVAERFFHREVELEWRPEVPLALAPVAVPRR